VSNEYGEGEGILRKRRRNMKEEGEDGHGHL
jgi:hypothetical protein